MNMQSLLFTLLLISAVGMGLGLFYAGVGEAYGKDVVDASGFSSTYDKFNDINDKFTSMEQSFAGLNILNPFTWGNILGFAANLVSIMADVPSMFYNVASSMQSGSGGLIPAWIIGFIEAAVVGIVVFAAIKLAAGTGGSI